jgi:hypothetical protein
MGKTKTLRGQRLTGRAFDALSPAEKERIVQELERTPTAELIARSKPLTRSQAALQRAMRQQIKQRRGRGRPKIGKGSKLVAVTLEAGFLEEVDRFARARKLKRSEMIAHGLRLLMAS